MTTALQAALLPQLGRALRLLRVLGQCSLRAADHPVAVARAVCDALQCHAVLVPLGGEDGEGAVYLVIAGHGLYAWGRDTAEAERVVEALEWLFAADLTERQYRAGARA